jgi:transcriptional regulator with XRE-family HTH domain
MLYVHYNKKHNSLFLNGRGVSSTPTEFLPLIMSVRRRKKKMASFGQYVHELRKHQQLTLRGFCEKFGIDPGNQSRLERDLLPPPKLPAAQRALARNLGLKEGTAEWQYFLDLAAICAGQIPQDLRADEEIAAKLPLIFRTLRGEKLGKDQLWELAELFSKEIISSPMEEPSQTCQPPTPPTTLKEVHPRRDLI